VTMTTAARSKAALLLLGFLWSSWLVPVSSSVLSARHPCASAVAPGAAGHRGHDPASNARAPSSLPVVGSHECSHCTARQCAMGQHCALPAPVGLASVPPAIDFVTSASPPVSWLRDRPRSSNPTPPIPPPQPVL
jgi:hypothetical protein